MRAYRVKPKEHELSDEVEEIGKGGLVLPYPIKFTVHGREYCEVMETLITDKGWFVTEEEFEKHL